MICSVLGRSAVDLEGCVCTKDQQSYKVYIAQRITVGGSRLSTSKCAWGGGGKGAQTKIPSQTSDLLSNSFGELSQKRYLNKQKDE